MNKYHKMRANMKLKDSVIHSLKGLRMLKRLKIKKGSRKGVKKGLKLLKTDSGLFIDSERGISA